MPWDRHTLGYLSTVRIPDFDDNVLSCARFVIPAPSSLHLTQRTLPPGLLTTFTASACRLRDIMSSPSPFWGPRTGCNTPFKHIPATKHNNIPSGCSRASAHQTHLQTCPDNPRPQSTAHLILPSPHRSNPTLQATGQKGHVVLLHPATFTYLQRRP